MKLSIDLSPNIVALAVLACCVALAVAAYTTRYPALPRHRRLTLLGARALCLAALLFASLAPVLSYSSASRERNRLLLLVDHSGSMEVRDGGGGGRTRREAADSAASAVASELGGRYDVRVAPFDIALGPIGKAASWKSAAPAPGAGETALGDALREALERADPDSIAALLVLSDGAVNRGEDPERALGGVLPAFALVVGSAEDPPTTGIAGVESPAEVVLGRQSSMTVTIRQGSRPAIRGTARLSEGTRELSRASFSLAGPGASTNISIPFTLTERGKHFLSVTLDSISGDPLPQNKRRLVAVTARQAKRTVPIVSTSWDWDLRSFSRGVEEDTAWAVRRLSLAGDAQVKPFGGATQSLTSALDGVEAVAVRFDARTMTPRREAELLRYIERGGGALLWIDPMSRPAAGSALAKALGLTWREWLRAPGLSTSIELTQAGLGHEISLLGGDGATAAATWRDLPPVQAPIAVTTRSGPLTALLNAHFGLETTPILLAGRLGAGRVAVLDAAGAYRWGLTASGLGGAGIEASFFGGLCTWLSRSPDDRAVRISALDLTPGGRAVPVRLTLADASRASGARATVVAHPVPGNGSAGSATLGPASATLGPASATLGPASATGDFSGSIALPEGVYSLVGRVERSGTLLGVDSLRIAVGEQGIEYESLRSEPETLERLTASSAGISAPLRGPGPVLTRLRSPEVARSRLVQMDIFHNPVLFLALILGATVEWVMRKRYHLL